MIMNLGIKWIIVIDGWIYDSFGDYKSADRVRNSLKERADIWAVYPNGKALREDNIKFI